MDDDFDFGFTIETEVSVVDNRAERIHAVVNNFLEKLKRNPTTDTIKWPNRGAEIEKFQQKLTAILNGEPNGS